MKKNLKRIKYKLIITLLVMTWLTYAKEDFVIPDSLVVQVDNGNAEAAYFIAKQLLEGSDTHNIDYNNAMIWLKKAANMGYPHAMEDLGYELDAKDSEKEALNWFKKAAELGVGDVLNKIALYHYQGKAGLPANCKTAYEWFKKAEFKEVKLAFNNHAWNLATAEDKSCRNPHKALKVISELMAIYADDTIIPWFVWDTRAAVLASVADFGTAIQLQEWIITEMQKDKLDVKVYQQHLDFYKLRKPWLEKNEVSY